MSIFIDAHMLGEQEGGNETYIAGLLHGFAMLNVDNIIPLYNTQYQTRIMAHRQRSLSLQSQSSLQRLLIELPRLCQKFNASLLHLTYNAPIHLSCPFVVTVHDVIFHRYPQYFAPRVRLLLKTLMPISMYRARAVITISEASKQDIVKHYPFVKNKIVSIPLAPGPLVETVPNMQAAQQISGGGDFILAVGTIQPRKNIKRLIEAYIKARVNDAIQASLIIVGASAWQGSEIQRIAQDSPYKNDIIFAGYLDDATVSALYRTCSIFIYPSLYEGFGLPVIEAMYCGAPVITSNCSSLPEVAGDAAYFIDPYSVDEIGVALQNIFNNADLRQALITRGRIQAQKFSWHYTAAATLDVYQQALATR